MTVEEDLWPQLLAEVRRLTPRQRELVRETFESVKSRATPNGVALFVKLFAEHPHYKDIWPQFQAVADSALISSDLLRNHAYVYMGGLQKVVNCMDDETALCSETKKIAQSHLKWKIHKRHIDNMVPGLLSVLSNCRDGNLTEEETEAWRTLYDIIGNLINIQKTY